MQEKKVNQVIIIPCDETSSSDDEYLNPIVATLGEQHFGRYTEVAFIQGWPLFRGGR